MKNIIAAIFLSIFVIVSNPAWANVYVCSILEIQTLSDAGQLHKTAWTKRMKDTYDKIIWDEESSSMVVGYNGGKPEKESFHIIQAGTDDNGTTAIHVYKGAVSTFTSFFRLKTFTDELPFMLTRQYEVWTGNCERL